MNRQVFYVRFINGNTLSQKEYRYLAKDSALEEVLIDMCCHIPGSSPTAQQAFRMANERGYDYKGSRAVVLFARIENLSRDEIADMRIIVKVSPDGAIFQLNRRANASAILSILGTLYS